MTMTWYATVALITLISRLRATAVDGRNVVNLPPEASQFFLKQAKSNRSGHDDPSPLGTRWAVLVAGSNGYENYRHQADVCHAYQILRKGGLKDENIIVFMYDDIAYNEDNPRPGIIVNNPHGKDVYKGVPKDYIGENVTADNFLAVIVGNKTALTGGSRKVLDSGPNDHIFVYYTDHGGPGVLGMPNLPNVYGKDLIHALRTKHASGTYKSLVFYVEACYSGSLFEGLLPEGLNIYVTTASNAEEDSFGTYCPNDYPTPVLGYGTCLGDLYSVAWMEDGERQNLRTETLKQQYQLVKKRTAVKSHVMQYGNLKLNANHLILYIGTSFANDSSTSVDYDSLRSSLISIKQHDADLLHFWYKFQTAPEGSDKKVAAQKEFEEIFYHRMHIDNSIELIGNSLFGKERGPELLNAVRPTGQPLVDDWECLKSMVRIYETHCGSLSQYGLKHMRSMANICNARIHREKMVEASSHACVTVPSNRWSSLHKGFSA